MSENAEQIHDIGGWNDELLMAVRQNLGLDADDSSCDREIAQMHWREVFYRFLKFYRIHGYVGSILNCLGDLGATFPDEKW